MATPTTDTGGPNWTTFIPSAYQMENYPETLHTNGTFENQQYFSSTWKTFEVTPSANLLNRVNISIPSNAIVRHDRHFPTLFFYSNVDECAYFFVGSTTIVGTYTFMPPKDTTFVNSAYLPICMVVRVPLTRVGDPGDIVWSTKSNDPPKVADVSDCSLYFTVKDEVFGISTYLSYNNDRAREMITAANDRNRWQACTASWNTITFASYASQSAGHLGRLTDKYGGYYLKTSEPFELAT